jgi:hypothetical protein
MLVRAAVHPVRVAPGESLLIPYGPEHLTGPAERGRAVWGCVAGVHPVGPHAPAGRAKFIARLPCEYNPYRRIWHGVKRAGGAVHVASSQRIRSRRPRNGTWTRCEWSSSSRWNAGGPVPPADWRTHRSLGRYQRERMDGASAQSLLPATPESYAALLKSLKSGRKGWMQHALMLRKRNPNE